jgi:hypothetical protein
LPYPSRTVSNCTCDLPEKLLGRCFMPHGAYCVAFKHNRWTVSQFGRDLGSFYFRAKALKFAVESACWSAVSNRPTVFVLDRTGDFYTAWCDGRDSLSAET